MQRTGAVGQRMVDLQIDAIAPAGDLKQQVAAGRVVQRTAGRAVLRLHHRHKVGFFQVVPEQPVFEHTAKDGEGFQRFFGGLLQNLLLHPLVELAGKAEHLGVLLIAGRRENFGGVVQPVPVRSSFTQARSPLYP